MRPAAWYGGVGVRAFSWLQTKAATSTVGQKLAKAGITPLLAMSLGIGGFDVAVTAEEVMAREEVVMVEAMETQLANRAIMADAGEEVYVLAQRLLYNAENGISMSASETVAAACSDFEVACTTGVLPTATHATLESALLSAFTEGCMSVGALQPLAAIGEQLMEMCDLTPVSFVDSSPYLNVGSIGVPENGYLDSLDPTLQVDGLVVPADMKLRGAGFDSDGNILALLYATSDAEIKKYADWASFNGRRVASVVFNQSSGRYLSFHRTRASEQFSSYEGYLRSETSVSLYSTIVSWDSTIAYVPSYGTSVTLFSGVTSDGVVNPVSGAIGKISGFFESGGEVIGNDAQFGDDGELIDAGTVNVTPTLYGDTNPSTWADALAAGEVNAVKPEAESPTAGDEVVAGEYEGKPVSEAIGKVNPPTVPQLQFAIDGNLGNIQDSVSEKFPFSIPFNVSRTVNLLIAEPEAPHFTWVFAVPTGDVEYEVDLAPFSPVAHVLRVMLDVLMVFVVISLLGKIAQVWGFFDRSAD